jgi:hypothetical protein
MRRDGEYRFRFQLAIKLDKDVEIIENWSYRKICGYAASLELDIEDEIAAHKKATADAQLKGNGKKVRMG